MRARKKICFLSIPEVGEKQKAQKKKKRRTKKVGENNGKLRFRPPPQVAHVSRLDQQLPATLGNATTCGMWCMKAAWPKL